MRASVDAAAAGPDAGVLFQLSEWFAADTPQSFFLTAGAGSGKTHTLICLLERLTGMDPGRRNQKAPTDPLTDREAAFAEGLRTRGAQIGVITYTNIARDEVVNRLGGHPRVKGQTIHSFCWGLIEGFDTEIRRFLLSELDADISAGHDELRKRRESLVQATSKLEAARAKAPTKKEPQASEERVRKAEVAANKAERDLWLSREKREKLAKVNRFTYSPDSGFGGNPSQLNHEQVMKTATELLRTKVGLQKILVARFPRLLVDECQDTRAGVLRALVEMESRFPNFAIGLIGDLRQRIYLDGLPQMTRLFEGGQWKRPELRANRRSGPRIVRLINQIWNAGVHGQGPEVSLADQEAISGEKPGMVRLFVGSGLERVRREEWVKRRMAELTGDSKWCSPVAPQQVDPPNAEVTLTPPNPRDRTLTLVLEHRLAAQRGGFLDVWDALHPKKVKGTEQDQGWPGYLRIIDDLHRVRSFWGSTTPAAGARLMAMLREVSPLLQPTNLLARGSGGQLAALSELRDGMGELKGMFTAGNDPTLGELVRCVARFEVLPLSDTCLEWAKEQEEGAVVAEEPPSEEDENSGSPAQDEGEPEESSAAKAGRRLLVMRELAKCRWSTIERATAYFAGDVGLVTQQGIKGSEAARVLAVLDDEMAAGNLFKFGKFFEVDELSKSDRENIAAGNDNGVARTRRLLYVVASRAAESLAIVLWTQEPAKAGQTALDNGWFDEGEIENIPLDSPSLLP
jgi:DNA helicase-2/ATP-dependent DNA helicase PcrA